MSTTDATASRSVDVDRAIPDRAFRTGALAGVLVLTASYVSVLLEVTGVVGGTARLLAVVAVVFAAATLLARAIAVRTAVGTALLFGAVGFGYYFTVTGVGVGTALGSLDRLASDTIAITTGMPLLRMMAVDSWALAFAPGPVFLSWYLAVRRRYVLGVLAGGIALAFLVLSGDAGVATTLAGTVGGIAAVGFGELELRRGTIAQADVLAVLFAAMVVLSLSVSLVPGGTPGPTVLIEGQGTDGSLEANSATAPEETTIAGNVSLSPEVRFTVRSERESYWRTGVYDRFTGEGWVRTGQQEAFDGRLEAPPGETETVNQTVTVEDDARVLPAAASPVEIEGDVREITERTDHGQFHPSEALIEGDRYNVESAVLNASSEELANASTDYPEEVTAQYLQQPEGVSAEFEDATAEVVADADDPHEAASAIEEHLRTEKGYSLNVTRPDGNVAEGFLLEMEEGYCVYFATTMTQMLRTEGIPARYVTGYTSGQQVDDNEWVVRGLNAHAWVEAYFPGHGWVAFDPTPGGDRDDVHYDRLEDARENNESGVDTGASEDVAAGPEGNTSDGPDLDRVEVENAPINVSEPAGGGVGPTEPPSEIPDGALPNDRGPNGSAEPGIDSLDPEGGNGSANATDGDDGEGDGEREFPPSSPETAIVGIAVLVGLAAGAHRTGATARVSRSARLQYQGRTAGPDADVERAYRRLEILLERRHRPREAGESTRQYVEALSGTPSFDPRARRVEELYERSTYGGGIDRAAANEAIDLVDRMAREELPAIGRLYTAGRNGR
ncbi:transglutaminase TgpA family protein [Saliphagus infecundisoli]|uniref:DUF3488 and DUF4129 domain-containing transglutaminase family protein n=1 Tax=Saliphagus infecundisoli TaxID=1849069 RepID=A0ABD5QIV3_9EURY|nr:transglutaminaseTgpA domain-containing protein [Saliphagus infecundisoli]